MKLARHLPTIVLSYLCYVWMPSVTWYQVSTAARGVYDLLNLPATEAHAGIDAYQYMIEMSNIANTSVTDVETEHVRAYYNVINRMLAVADIEKLYIPPQLDPSLGLYQNQFLVEKDVFAQLGPHIGSEATLMDMGCGRGRISHHAARSTGAKVRGYNIDDSQVQNAIEYATATGMAERLDFRVGDHHKPLPYADSSFDGAFSFQAVWPFFKVAELDQVAREMFRVLKPDACSEYLLSPAFDPADEVHLALHQLFLPTLAATQSRYPAEVVAALERAGFKVVLSAPPRVETALVAHGRHLIRREPLAPAPSRAPAWPLTDQKTELFLGLRRAVGWLEAVGLAPPWATAEKMKIADLNWRITAEKPAAPPTGLAKADDEKNVGDDKKKPAGASL